jgi:hypothetical protein
MEIIMHNTMDINGFQFELSGVALSLAACSGGTAGDAGFQVSNTEGGNMVLGFSLLGASIPASVEPLVLTNCSYTALADEACIINEILSLTANDIGFYEINIGECAALTCDDVDADGVCDDVDDCVGEYDECGACNGGGIANGACDCDGNVEDCAGECGGGAVEDECGECGGDGSYCVVHTHLSLELDESGDIAVMYDSDAAIYGFQFDVSGDGFQITGVSGGDAGATGFTVSTGNNTVIAGRYRKPGGTCITTAYTCNLKTVTRNIKLKTIYSCITIIHYSNIATFI